MATPATMDSEGLERVKALHNQLVEQYSRLYQQAERQLLIKPFVHLHIKRHVEQLRTAYIHLKTLVPDADPFDLWLKEQEKELREYGATFSSRPSLGFLRHLLPHAATLMAGTGITYAGLKLSPWCVCWLGKILPLVLIGWLYFLFIDGFRDMRAALLGTSGKRGSQDRNVYKLEDDLFTEVGTAPDPDIQWDVFGWLAITILIFVAPHVTEHYVVWKYHSPLIFGFLAAVMTIFTLWRSLRRQWGWTRNPARVSPSGPSA